MSKGEKSSYIIFAEKIAGKKWRKGVLHKKFLQQVNKSDYLPSELDEIFAFLEELTMGSHAQYRAKKSICPPCD